MPAGSTPVRHYRQSSPGACLPACVRTVLVALGDERTEERLAAAMGSYEFSTPASRSARGQPTHILDYVPAQVHCHLSPKVPLVLGLSGKVDPAGVRGSYRRHPQSLGLSVSFGQMSVPLSSHPAISTGCHCHPAPLLTT